MKIVRGGQGAPLIVVPFMAQKKFSIFCYWVNRRFRLGESTAAGQFTEAAIQAYGHLMAQESKDNETEGVKAPAEFKAGSKWKPFKEGCIAFFNTNLGMDRVPFSYIIREDAAPGDPNIVYPNEHSRLISITPHAGLEYENDNGRVFDYLNGKESPPAHLIVLRCRKFVPIVIVALLRPCGRWRRLFALING